MVKHYNSSIIDNTNRIFGFKQGNNISSEVGAIIVPVKEIQPKLDVIKIDSAENFVTPTDKDLYIDCIQGCGDGAVPVQLTAVVNGVVRTLFYTGANMTLAVDFKPYGVKIDRNTQVTLDDGVIMMGHYEEVIR